MHYGEIGPTEFAEKLAGAWAGQKITLADLMAWGRLSEERMRAVCEKIGAAGYAGHPRRLGDLSGAMSRHVQHVVAEDARVLVSVFAQGVSVGIAYADEQRGWTRDDASVTHYADNSIEVDHVARDGGRRRVTEKAPSGDACF